MIASDVDPDDQPSDCDEEHADQHIGVRESRELPPAIGGTRILRRGSRKECGRGEGGGRGEVGGGSEVC